MKFLCDEMLKGLTRWLRAAGHDVVVEPDGTDDRILIERTHQEGRILLTRDRRLVEAHPADKTIVLLDCNEPDACMQELHRRLGVDWLYHPFSRCLKCNTPLVDASPEQWREIPEVSRESATLLRYCPNCKQLFWDGSHVARMRARLERANQAAR